jgi:hypothetical protein
VNNYAVHHFDVTTEVMLIPHSVIVMFRHPADNASHRGRTLNWLAKFGRLVLIGWSATSIAMCREVIDDDRACGTSATCADNWRPQNLIRLLRLIRTSNSSKPSTQHVSIGQANSSVRNALPLGPFRKLHRYIDLQHQTMHQAQRTYLKTL